MPKKKYAPRPGSKIAFVAAHLGLTNLEVQQKAKEAGLELSIPVIDASRWTLKNKFKMTKSSTATAIVPYQATAAVVPKRKYKARANKKTDEDNSPKEAMIRKLVFEIGYDKANLIFREFQEMHSRWS